MSSNIGGEQRKQFYMFVENILGRSMNKYEHTMLRRIIKEYVNARTEDYQKKLHEANIELDRYKRKCGEL